MYLHSKVTLELTRDPWGEQFGVRNRMPNYTLGMFLRGGGVSFGWYTTSNRTRFFHFDIRFRRSTPLPPTRNPGSASDCNVGDIREIGPALGFTIWFYIFNVVTNKMMLSKPVQFQCHTLYNCS